MIWCAEIGSMHRGNKSLAYELVRQAKWAGATIAKFQLGWTREAQEKYAGNYDERRYIDPWAEELGEWCRQLDVEFMASIWSFEGLEVARKVGMKRYKIAHQMNDPDLIRAIANDKKPTFWSLDGKSTHGIESYPWGIHAVMPVLSSDEYPTEKMPDWASFHAYSSHMHGIADALIAVARGAQFIEKHITLDKTMDWPRDASFALLPSEFKQMVEIGEEIARLR